MTTVTATKTLGRILFATLLLLLCLSNLESYSDWLLMGDFKPGWKKNWKERILADRGNSYQILQENGYPVLLMKSNRSASGFWRQWEMKPVSARKITWRWKVESSLVSNVRERQKQGDDFAARVFVVFEPHFFSWKTKSLCYVWAGNEPEGSIYKNPFSDSVGQIVLQSGNKNAGRWVREERDFVADYRRYFKKDPTQISAFAVMVDTDNTSGHAKAWFADLRIDRNRRP